LALRVLHRRISAISARYHTPAGALGAIGSYYGNRRLRSVSSPIFAQLGEVGVIYCIRGGNSLLRIDFKTRLHEADPFR
jgi:hypothetical protein